MSRSRFRINLYSIVAWMSRNPFLENRHDIWSLSDSNRVRIHNHLVGKRTLDHLAKLGKLSNCHIVKISQAFYSINNSRKNMKDPCLLVRNKMGLKANKLYFISISTAAIKQYILAELMSLMTSDLNSNIKHKFTDITKT